LALYFCREYAAAAEAARQGIRLYPDRPGSYRVLAAALGQLGLIAEAKEALEKAIAIAPEQQTATAEGSGTPRASLLADTCADLPCRP
jgi:tetratricopeptide (TPR) repeat protein